MYWNLEVSFLSWEWISPTDLIKTVDQMYFIVLLWDPFVIVVEICWQDCVINVFLFWLCGCLGFVFWCCCWLLLVLFLFLLWFLTLFWTFILWYLRGLVIEQEVFPCVGIINSKLYELLKLAQIGFQLWWELLSPLEKMNLVYFPAFVDISLKLGTSYRLRYENNLMNEFLHFVVFALNRPFLQIINQFVPHCF